MRTASFFVLLLVVLAQGCGKKDTSPTGAATPPTQPDTSVVKSWKPYKAEALLFKTSFPLGDPMVRPVFFGNQPKVVQEGWDYSVDVYGKNTGKEPFQFSIRAARFKTTPKPAERDETLEILMKTFPLQGWTKGESKTVTWAGQQATETVWSEPAKTTKMIIRHFVIDSGVYIGFVKDLGTLPPTEMAKFFEEFQVLAK